MHFYPYFRILTLSFFLVAILAKPQLTWSQETLLPEEEEIAQRVDTVVEPILRVEDTRMILEIDALLRARVYLRSGIHARRLTTSEPPPFFEFSLQGKGPLIFESDEEQVQEIPIRTEMGAGRRVTCFASASLPRGTVEVKLEFEHYENHPGIVSAQAELHIPQGAGSVFLQSSSNGILEMFTRKRQGGYWYFQGFGGDGNYHMNPLLPGFKQDNPLPLSLVRNGFELPLIDVWFPRGGLAIGFLELGETPQSLPVEVDNLGNVRLRMKQQVGRKLSPGESWKTQPIFISTHEGDFFESLGAYGRWMTKRRRFAPAKPRIAYQPRWSFGGVENSFSLQDLRKNLPVLKDLGIRWVVMDRRWFEGAQGRILRSNLLPEEGGFKQVMEEIHQGGFLVCLRLSPIEARMNPRSAVFLEGAEGKSSLTSSSPKGLTPSQVSLPDAGSTKPEWFVLDSQGQPVQSPEGNQYLCPALVEVQAFVRRQARRWFMDWGVDVVEQESVVIFPLCFNSEHAHSSPKDSRTAFPRVQEILTNTARVARKTSSMDPSTVNFNSTSTWSPCYDRRFPSSISPPHLRLSVKVFRALCGEVPGLVSHSADMNQFASSLALGVIPKIDFSSLDSEEEEKYQKWLGLDRRLQISRGQYINSYDLAFSFPESHLVRRYGLLYHSFFTRNPGGSFKGRVRFRGLSDGLSYRVFDYWNQVNLGIVTSRRSRLNVKFQDFLLLQLKPELRAGG